MYDPILPGVQDWPVVHLAKNRKTFVEEVVKRSVERIKKLRDSKAALFEELELTVFKEKSRLKETPWEVDPDDEKEFWGDVRSRLASLPKEYSAELAMLDYDEEDLLREVVERYAEEIAGDFRPSYYKLARAIVTFGLTRFLNAARLQGIDRFYRNELSLRDKVKITGEVELVRSLAKKGTVLMVPTHFSNLDSIVIGWVIHTLGLPPLIYGAGLNLFNMKIFAYFMNSLGAYKVDRRKKNLLYIETLKAYSSLAMEKGIHSLFFPGGTRSRSGKIEKKLKLGLLSTAFEAQRRSLLNARQGGESNKIFIVPVVLNYNFVLEAEELIKNYLKTKGQERYYIESSDNSTSLRIIKFIFKFMTKGGDISVSLGRPMDLFGNFVDKNGDAYDLHNRLIDIEDYFKSNGVINEDLQRESEYTKMLGKRIVEEFHKNNRVSASHLVAFTVFYMLRRRHKKLDLFNLLRLPNDDLVVNYVELKRTFTMLREQVLEAKRLGRLDVSDSLQDEDIDEMIRFGIKNCGMYHTERPILFNKGGNVTTQNINTLYYYSNRLIGYGFEKYI
ncbi:MAG: 1-acyl-sn-glycerol-3-phosphate acyltransferase [Cytophagales bacterium]|nr:1-acyl-sn-glycerol-3-phosphate acyltransferase [Cytophagales bacterium]